MSWVHKLCSGITKRLVEDLNYICPSCKGRPRSINDRTVTEVDVEGTMIDFEATFYNLGDILCSGGGCGSAIAGRWYMALPWPAGTSHPEYLARCLSPAFDRLCSMVKWGPKETRTASAPPQRRCRDPMGLCHQREGRNTLNFAITENDGFPNFNGAAVEVWE